MANEPERPIEKLLRAAAQKRRDDAGPPFVLHPADRRLLQGEVTRKFAKPQPQNRSLAALLGQLWPRLAGGVAILALLGLAVRTLLPLPHKDKSEALLARNVSASEDMLAQEPQPVNAPAPTAVSPAPAPTAKQQPALVALTDTAPTSPLSEFLQSRMAESPPPEESATAQLKSPDAAKLALAPTQQAADRLESAIAVLAESQGTPAPTQTLAVNSALDGAAGRPPAQAPVVATEAPARLMAGNSAQPSPSYRPSATVASANRSSPSSAVDYALAKPASEPAHEAKALTVAQRFVQVPLGAQAWNSLADSAPAPHPVLASFQVEQSGTVLRIVDGDGSVYTGSLQPATVARRTRSAKAEAPADTFGARYQTKELEQATASRLDSDAQAQQSYAFRVTGTNRSLQKQVVFTGNLLTTTNLTLSLPAATDLAVGAVVAERTKRDTLSYGQTNLGLQGTLGRSQLTTPQPAFLPLPNSRISGKVVVGTGKPTNINALPTSP
jgi:hypothetical protein